MKKAYCRWWNKFLEDVAEHEQDECHKTEMECETCGNMDFVEEEEN